jgi:hypothetical protein
VTGPTRILKGPKESTGVESPRRVSQPVILAAAVAVVGVYAVTGLRTWDIDAYAYGAAARDVLRGESLYLTAWQDKPPLGILAYALPQMIAPGSPVGLQAFLGLVVLAQAGVVCGLLPGHPRDRTVVAALVVFLPMTGVADVPLMTEHLANLFVMVNLALAVRMILRGRFDLWEAAVSGAATVLAFNTRQNTLLSGLAPLTALALTAPPGRRLSGAIAWAAGGVLAFAAVLALLVSVGGDLAGYYYTVFEYPKRYSAMSTTGENMRNAGILIYFLLSSPLILFLAAPWVDLRGWRLPTILGVATAAMVGGCLAPFKPFAHYFINLFPCAAAAWAGWAAQGVGREPRFPRPLAVGTMIFLASCGAGMALFSVGARERHLKLDAVCAAVDAAAGPGGTTLVVGDGSQYIHFHGRTPPAHTYYNEMQLNYFAGLLPRPFDAILGDYLDQPPTVLAVGPPAGTPDGAPGRGPELVNQIRARHRYVSRGTVNGFEILVRADGGPPAAGPEGGADDRR